MIPDSAAEIGYCPASTAHLGGTCTITWGVSPKGATFTLAFFFFNSAFVLESLPPLPLSCNATYCTGAEGGGGPGAIPWAWRIEATNNIANVNIIKMS
jgi:hypothetical protein